MVRKALLAFILILCASLVSAQSAECGQVLTSDFTLTSDILDCPSNGLIVGSHNIVIDCDGHSIKGDDHEPWGFDTSAGILLHNYNNVVVKNCEITDFQDGLRITAGNDNVIEDNVFSNNERAGIMLLDHLNLEGVDIANNVIRENEFYQTRKFGVDIYIFDEGNAHGEAEDSTEINIKNNEIYMNSINGEGVIDITDQNSYCSPEGQGNFYDPDVPAGRQVIDFCGVVPYPGDDDNSTDGDDGNDDNTTDDDTDDTGFVERTLRCGDVILESTALENDVFECFNLGLEIINDDLTLDCRGHRIVGANNFLSAGIFLSGVENVTIKNCYISNFDEGIAIEASQDIDLLNNIFDENSVGVNAEDLNPFKFEENEFVNNNVGAELKTTRNGFMISNSIKNNDVAGFRMEDSDSAIVSLNAFEDNGKGVVLVSSDDGIVSSNTFTDNDEGIVLRLNSKRNEVKDNTVTESVTGMLIDWSDKNLVTSNTFESNGDGIVIAGSYDNLVEGNDIRYNSGNGLSYVSSEDNMIKNSEFYNRVGESFDLFDLGQTKNNIVYTNDFLGNGVVDDADVNIYCWPNDENGIGNFYANYVSPEHVVVGPCGKQSESDDSDDDSDDGDDDDDPDDDDNGDGDGGDDDDDDQTTLYDPVIGIVYVNILSNTEASLNFETDVETRTTVIYNIEDGLRYSLKDNSYETDHEFIMNNLRPGKRVYFYIIAEAENGQTTRSKRYSFVMPGGSGYDDDDDDDRSRSRDIRIMHIQMSQDYARVGETVEFNLELDNTGSYDRDRLKISISIPELGIRDIKSNEELDSGDFDNYRLHLEIPMYTLPGDYDVHITVSDNNIRRTKHRILSVF